MKSIFSEMASIRVLLIFAVLFLPIAGFSQEIKILDESGNAKTLKPAKIVFNTPTNQTVEIYRVLNETSSSSVTLAPNLVKPGQIQAFNSSSYGINKEFLCKAPVKLELPGGFYKFNTGDGAAFSIDADGGTQYWKLSGMDNLEFGGGLLLLLGGEILGGLGLAFGIINNDSGLLAVGIIGGLGGCVGGGVMMGDSFPKAQLIKIEF